MTIRLKKNIQVNCSESISLRSTLTYTINRENWFRSCGNVMRIKHEGRLRSIWHSAVLKQISTCFWLSLLTAYMWFSIHFEYYIVTHLKKYISYINIAKRQNGYFIMCLVMIAIENVCVLVWAYHEMDMYYELLIIK